MLEYIALDMSAEVLFLNIFECFKIRIAPLSTTAVSDPD